MRENFLGGKTEKTKFKKKKTDFGQKDFGRKKCKFFFKNSKLPEAQ